MPLHLSCVYSLTEHQFWTRPELETVQKLSSAPTKLLVGHLFGFWTSALNVKWHFRVFQSDHHQLPHFYGYLYELTYLLANAHTWLLSHEVACWPEETRPLRCLSLVRYGMVKSWTDLLMVAIHHTSYPYKGHSGEATTSFCKYFIFMNWYPHNN